MAYQPRRPHRSLDVPVRGLRYHVAEWGDAAAAPLVMLHGWMDVALSFQFIVDALSSERRVLAPDWRGFGRSSWANADCYWFPDYLADLEALLDALAGEAPVDLVGHSMGGNVAMLYAGIRPRRVRSVVNLEGFGLRETRPEQAPARYAQWLDELKTPPTLRDYDSPQAVAARLRKTNPRLPSERAEFLASHWAQPDAHGRWRIAGDPAHRIVNPVLYRWSEAQACWAQIEAPVLWIEGRETDAHKWAGSAAELDVRRRALPRIEFQVIPEAGHMVHHDQPLVVAQLIEAFLARLPS